MALPPTFLDELRARTPMPGLVGRRVRLSKSGRNWKGLCPFHSEKSPSFYVYDDSFHCFGCGAHGDAFAYVMRAEGGGFMEAVERLAGEAGLDVPKPTPEAAARDRRARDLHGVLQAAEAAYARRLRMPEGAEALAYLRNRGLTDETIRKFGLGWSGAGRGALAAELREEGIQQAQLLEAGLMQEREEGRAVDLFFNRVMFPIRDRRGRGVSFGGRILGDGQPKYVNGPETALFSKRRNLYALDLAREGVFRGASLIVAEGYMDVIALHQAGFAGAVAPLGTALTEEQMKSLWQVSPEPVLCFDGDAAGIRAAARAAELALPLLAPERTLRFMTLPAGEDPDTLIRKGGPRAFQAALDAAQPLSQALFGLIVGGKVPESPEGRAALRNRLAAAAQTIPDRALAAEFRRSLLDRFFSLTKRPGLRAAPRHPRPEPDREAAQAKRARILLAICIHHPELLHDIEEPLSLLDLPAGAPQQVRNALLAWVPEASRLDSGELIAHLASGGAASASQWVLKVPDLPREAGPGGQPKEALDAFWQFFGFLRGEAELAEDARAAREAFEAQGDLATQTRLIRLTEALDALRRGEAEAEPNEMS
ncbi:DNA primase [Roseococcus sp. SYP-B2431]|uniref:DNA primase n=1 Tax=Roseococcus sp. SYP-B2431 TaxID=2496640 RepID=UPI00103B9A6C|nr:DNA primase [Roseococcus sp. SYP-B2431]TCH97884.1 DNA primase [Roseococcus sp. SYP-B2431]